MKNKNKYKTNIKMKETLNNLRELYLESEKNLRKKLSSRKNHKRDCDCKKETEKISILTRDGWDEVDVLCLKCGGNIKW